MQETCLLSARMRSTFFLWKMVMVYSSALKRCWWPVSFSLQLYSLRSNERMCVFITPRSSTRGDLATFALPPLRYEGFLTSQCYHQNLFIITRMLDKLTSKHLVFVVNYKWNQEHCFFRCLLSRRNQTKTTYTLLKTCKYQKSRMSIKMTE